MDVCSFHLSVDFVILQADRVSKECEYISGCISRNVMAQNKYSSLYKTLRKAAAWCSYKTTQVTCWRISGFCWFSRVIPLC